MKKQVIFEAEDGKTFITSEECKSHDDVLFFGKLVGLTPDDVDAALSRHNVPLADAIERAGNIISAQRIADGDLRRKSKKAALDSEPIDDVATEMRRVNLKKEPTVAISTVKKMQSA